MPMNDKGHLRLKYSLRFIVNSLEEREQFKERYPQYNVGGRRYFKDKTKYVVSVRLEDDIDLKPLEKYVTSFDGKLNYNFFISISTSNDSEIVEVPGFVIDCIRNIGGEVNFSFTCIG